MEFLYEILKLQKLIIRAIFFIRPSESLVDIIENHKFFTVFDFFLREIFKMLFHELLGRSPHKFFLEQLHSRR